MNFVAEINVMPLKELLDPQGKAVLGGLSNLGIKSIGDVRIGKHIQLQIDATNADAAKNIWVNERVRIKKFDAHFHLLHTWNLRDSTNSKNLNGPSVTFICGEDLHHNIWFTDSNSVFKIDAVNHKVDSSFNDKLKKNNPAYNVHSSICSSSLKLNQVSKITQADP